MNSRLEKNFIGPKLFIMNERSSDLQILRDRLFKENRIKSGKLFQLNAIHSFHKALEWSNNDLSFENVNRNFRSALGLN